MILVKLASAIICFAGQCHPVLVGAHTPTGTFSLTLRYVSSPGYGGDVLQFLSVDSDIYAIHRAWLLDKKHDRKYLLAHGTPAERRFVSNGCINLEPPVYESLKACCANQELHVEP